MSAGTSGLSSRNSTCRSTLYSTRWSAAVNHLVEYNVDRQVEFLLDSPDVPADTTVVGAVYDFMDVYTDHRGEIQIVNVDGETDTDTLRDAHPEIDDRIRRLWEY